MSQIDTTQQKVETAQLHEDVLAEFKTFKVQSSKKYRWILYEIKEEKEKGYVVYVASATGSKGGLGKDHKDFISSLPDTRCRYCLYEYEYDKNGIPTTGKIYSIFWCPENTTPQERVMYTNYLNSFRLQLSGVDNQLCQTGKEVSALLSGEKIRNKGDSSEAKDEKSTTSAPVVKKFALPKKTT